jgi:hypothetical protein
LAATPSAAPVKLADGTVAKFIGVQVDVTHKTEGTCSAFADGAPPDASRVRGRCIHHP